MITIRQLERQWTTKDFDRMFRQCMEMRPEDSVRIGLEMGRALPAAAMAVVRLDELGQSFAPFYGRLVRTVLAAQEADGGWGDAMTTALCIRALACGNGQGAAIDRAFAYLAALQKSEGAWPRIPIRRLPADAFATAFVVYQLLDDPRFAATCRVDEALEWLDRESLDLDTQRLHRHLGQRRGVWS